MQRLIWAGIGAAILALAVGIASAAIPSSGGVINGCYQKVNGQLRVIDTTQGGCAPSETALNWNQTGPKGDKGDKGDPGQPGQNGLNGQPGPAGTIGSLNDLSGKPCTFSGNTGVVALSAVPAVQQGVMNVQVQCIFTVTQPPACSNPLNPPNATSSCNPATGQFSYQCLSGFADANGDIGVSGGNGCEINLLTDINNCGSLGNSAANLPHAVGACVGGFIAVSFCLPGFINLDGNPANGCEVNGDLDHDGYISSQLGGNDCDDTDSTIHPGAVDTPNDGRDQDCDGQAN